MQSVEPGIVLLVESDPFVLRVVETALSREGFTVISTDNGAQALEAFFRHAHKLFLMLVSIDRQGVHRKHSHPDAADTRHFYSHAS
jgi:DNA-binding response OmpR family regulator